MGCLGLVDGATWRASLPLALTDPLNQLSSLPCPPSFPWPACRKGTSDYTKNVLTLRMESGSEEVKTDHFEEAVLVAAGRDPFMLVEEAVAAAAARSGSARPLREKQLPPNLDVFGWCSWDSFYSAVSASGLSDAVQSLSSGGTPPRWVVIDDGWQCTDVDEPYRQFPTEQLAERLKLPRKEVGAGLG